MCRVYCVWGREHVYVYVCVHVRVLILVEARDHPQVAFLRVKFWDSISLWGLGLPSSTRLAGQQALELSLPISIAVGFQASAIVISFVCGYWRSNLGLQAYTAAPSLAELLPCFPNPTICFVKWSGMGDAGDHRVRRAEVEEIQF